MLISAAGVHLHQFWMMILGSGIIGGIGLGLGYISPVSTLIKWFPDRRGMATGMAIMGFGGGAMIGVAVDDLTVAEQAVIAAGGRITVPVFDFPGGRRFEASTPHGHRVALFRYDGDPDAA